MVTQYTTVLDVLPLWGLFLTVVVLVLAAIEGGYRLGGYRPRQPGREKEAPVGAMVGAMLGLLAFMLAFTFGMAASRFDTRKQLVLDEANAIGTTYLRSAMLPDRRDEIRALLRSYGDGRLEAGRGGRAARSRVRPGGRGDSDCGRHTGPDVGGSDSDRAAAPRLDCRGPLRRVA